MPPIFELAMFVTGLLGMYFWGKISFVKESTEEYIRRGKGKDYSYTENEFFIAKYIWGLISFIQSTLFVVIAIYSYLML